MNKHRWNCTKTAIAHTRTRSTLKERFLAKKRKEGWADSDEAPAARMRRSQVTDFEFETQCLICANVCEPLNLKHAER